MYTERKKIMNISLDGKWNLYFFEQQNYDETPEVLTLREDVKKIECTVPGNVELDLAQNSYLPKDLYMGMNITEAERYETYEWWYEKFFETPNDIKNLYLRFEAVDCLAEYWLNGKKIGESDNMFIAHEFDISQYVKQNGENRLLVRLRSAVLENYCLKQNMYSVVSSWEEHTPATTQIRKAAHSVGWDIMPRAVSAGIWRSVYVINKADIYFDQVFVNTYKLEEDTAYIKVAFDIKSNKLLTHKTHSVKVYGKCGDSEFCEKRPVIFKAEAICFDIKNPKLWFPFGYGMANMYDAAIELYEEEKLICKKEFSFGVRTVELERSDTVDLKDGKFNFKINGVQVMCKGSNWVPLCTYHSGDAARYERALELVRDIGCNILRCWGGNVYEDTYFYDFCDRNGIMIWQDFSMACSVYPIDDEFKKKLEIEVESVVKKLRQHPCVILWSGDNECDESMFGHGVDPNENILTRRVIPHIIKMHDMTRPYIPSSPYISKKVYDLNDKNLLPEAHLWGPRDYFKSNFYKESPAYFVSETGYHGCPSRKSVEKFIEKDYIENYKNNPQWNLHSTDRFDRDGRVMLMHNQVLQYFGEIPKDFDDYTLASQVSQAEADKFFIERIRARKPKTGGVIWWNLLDGWPQMSDAVVDYYFEKKLAYDYIKRSQAPFCIMAKEIEDWKIQIVAENDTLEEKCVTYEVCDIDTNEVLLSGECVIGKNSFKNLGNIAVMYSEKRMLLIKWTQNGKFGFNHYTCGMPAFSFEKYKTWLKKLENIKA